MKKEKPNERPPRPRIHINLRDPISKRSEHFTVYGSGAMSQMCRVIAVAGGVQNAKRKGAKQ